MPAERDTDRHDDVLDGRDESPAERAGFLFDVVVDPGAGVLAAVVLALVILILWVVAPLVLRIRARTEIHS